jgi:hypothetical protein
MEMKKFLPPFIAIVPALLLAIVAYDHFQVKTKSIFFSIFPIFSWKSVDQPILFNHIIHKDKEKVNLNCALCHRYVEGWKKKRLKNGQ